jgi:adenylate cyclase
MVRLGRRVLPELPPATRCKLCLAPSGGWIGRLARLIGRQRAAVPSPLCAACLRAIAPGCEREVSILFADVRGSTALAEHLTPTAFSEVMRGFYARTAAVVGRFDGTVDKFVGDGVVALFFAGESRDHARSAVDAAHALVASLDGDRESRPWPPVAVGVHTGTAWLGLIPGPHGTDDLTALGDPVNVAAHLCTAAGAGEVAISTETWNAAGVPEPVAARSLRLKRRRRPIGVRFSGAGAQSCFALGGGESKSLRYSP